MAWLDPQLKEKCRTDQPDAEILNLWLSHFVVEARSKDGEPYPARSIYLLLSGLLRHGWCTQFLSLIGFCIDLICVIAKICLVYTELITGQYHIYTTAPPSPHPLGFLVPPPPFGFNWSKKVIKTNLREWKSNTVVQVKTQQYSFFYTAILLGFLFRTLIIASKSESESFSGVSMAISSNRKDWIVQFHFEFLSSLASFVWSSFQQKQWWMVQHRLRV